ncbi:MAG: hypothetical protein AAF723_04635 [Pseudomonadota bacterium]
MNIETKLLQHGLERDIVALRQLYTTDHGRAEMRALLLRFLSAYAKHDNAEDENIYFAGMTLRKAGAMEAADWTLNWAQDTTEYQPSTRFFTAITFLLGVLGEDSHPQLLAFKQRVQKAIDGNTDGGQGGDDISLVVDDVIQAFLPTTANS